VSRRSQAATGWAAAADRVGDSFELTKPGFTARVAFLSTTSGADLGFPAINLTVQRAPLSQVVSERGPAAFPSALPLPTSATLVSATTATSDEQGTQIIPLVDRPSGDARATDEAYLDELGTAGLVVDARFGQRGPDGAKVHGRGVAADLTLLTAPGVEPSIALEVLR
jgi:hypothetical protein